MEYWNLDDIETFDDIKKQIDNTKNYASEYQKYTEKIININREFNLKLQELNPYSNTLSQLEKEKEALSLDLLNSKDAKEKKLNLEKWYSQEYEKILQNRENLSNKEKNNSFINLNSIFENQLGNFENNLWQAQGEKIGDIFGDGLADILKEYQDFDISMRKISQKLYDYIIEQSVNALVQQIFGVQQMQNILAALGSGAKQNGWLGAASSIVKGIGKSFGIFHSGGIVPVGANAEIPGTTEQLALLKGGERILSPAENTSYNNNNSQNTSPVVFNNFNIKAWDSKDVKEFLIENKELLNSITAEGIKYNTAHLRNMVLGK